jgi:hypothetical protein
LVSDFEGGTYCEKFENRVLRKIFGLKREVVTGGKGRLFNEKQHDLCFSPNIIWVILSRRLRWLGHVSDMEERRVEVHTVVWWGNLKERDHVEALGIDERIVFKWIFKRWDGMVHRLGLSVSGQGLVAGFCECGYESLGSIKYREFLDQLNHKLLKKDSVP